MIVAFRRHTLLPLDDCLYALQPSIPGLTRSSLQRCLQRHGISPLPDLKGDKPARKRFMSYPTGFFHMDIAEVHTGEGKLYLFVAIDRTSKFAVARLWDGQVLEPSTISNLDYTVDVGVTLVSTDNGNVFSLWGSEHDLIVKGSVSGGTAIHFGDEIGDTGNRLVVSSMADVRGATRGVSFQSLGRRFSTTATSGAARACMSRVQGEITSNGQIRSSSYLSTGAANDVATNRGATIRDVPLGVGNDVSEDVGGVAR